MKVFNKMFLLRCPKCRNTMKYQSRTKDIGTKRKKCVYCGFSMDVVKSVVKEV